MIRSNHISLPAENIRRMETLLGNYPVGAAFCCQRNELITLEGAPESVRAHFDCFNNNLESLKGAPKITGGFHVPTTN